MLKERGQKIRSKTWKDKITPIKTGAVGSPRNTVNFLSFYSD